MTELTRYIDYLIIAFKMRNVMSKLYFYIKGHAAEIKSEADLKRVVSSLIEIDESIKVDDVIHFLKVTYNLVAINEKIKLKENFNFITSDSYLFEISDKIKIDENINPLIAISYLILINMELNYKFDIKPVKAKSNLFNFLFNLNYIENINPKETETELMEINEENMVKSKIALYSASFVYTTINEIIKFIDSFEIKSADSLLFYLNKKAFDYFQSFNLAKTTSHDLYIEEIIKSISIFETKKANDNLFYTSESSADCFKSNILVTIEGTRTIGQMATLTYGDIADLTLYDLFYYIQN